MALAKEKALLLFPVEVQFAQKLASNIKEYRDKAIKKLKSWLYARSSSEKPFTEDDLLKIWKGLFYCMWMSDKPLIQEDLADDISLLIHSFSTTESALAFIRVFFITIAREWYGIDELRLNKFLMLIRRFLHQSLQLLKQCQWHDESVNQFLDILKETPASLNHDLDIPVGFQHHVIDIFLDELSICGAEELSVEQSLKFLEPFFNIVAYSKRKVLIQNVFKNIFLEIVEQSPFVKQTWEDAWASGEKADNNEAINDEEEETKYEEEAPEDEATEDEKEKKHLKFDYRMIVDKLSSLDEKKFCSSYNRKIVEKLSERFQQLADETYEVRTMVEMEDSELSEDEVETVLQKSLEEDIEYFNKSRNEKILVRKLKKKKKSGIPEDLSKLLESEEKNLKNNKKRKKMNSSPSALNNTYEVNLEIDHSENLLVDNIKKTKKTSAMEILNSQKDSDNINPKHKDGIPHKKKKKKTKEYLSQPHLEFSKETEFMNGLESEQNNPQNKKRKKIKFGLHIRNGMDEEDLIIEPSKSLLVDKIKKKKRKNSTLEVLNRQEESENVNAKHNEESPQKKKKKEHFEHSQLEIDNKIKCTNEVRPAESRKGFSDNRKENNTCDNSQMVLIHPTNKKHKIEHLIKSKSTKQKTPKNDIAVNVNVKELEHKIPNQKSVGENIQQMGSSPDSGKTLENEIKQDLKSPNTKAKMIKFLKNLLKKSSDKEDVNLFQMLPEDDNNNLSVVESDYNNPNKPSQLKISTKPKKNNKYRQVNKSTDMSLLNSMTTEITLKNKFSQNTWDEPQEGEVDIFVPSKKYAKKVALATGEGKKKMLKNKTYKNSQAFVQLESVKPSGSLVRLALKKSYTKLQSKLQTQISPASGKKKVNFAMSKNGAQDLASYCQSIKNKPGIPFDANKQPHQGVLKSPVSPVNPNQFKCKKSFLKKKNRPKAVDFF